MVSRVCVALWIEVLLPGTEAGQRGVCMVDDLQIFLNNTESRQPSHS